MTLSQDRSPSLDPRIQPLVQADLDSHPELELPIDCNIRFAVSLKGLTTWKVGGLAQFYLEPRTLAETQIGLAWAKQMFPAGLWPQPKRRFTAPAAKRR